MARPSRKDIAKSILALSDRQPATSLARAVAAYLIQERRSSELDVIMREVNRLREQQANIVEATVTTASPLNQKIVQQIKQLLGDKVIVNNIIDKKVIGGVRVETSDLNLDLTVRNRLERLKTSKQGAIN